MRALIWAGTLTGAASVLHIAIIVGGADWYRFFGAGEEMAQLSEQGALFPALLTFVIAGLLAIFSLYAFSGAGIIRRLPLLTPSLFLIASVFLARGVFAIPAVLYGSSSYIVELADRMGFMLASSFICLVIGGFYALGAYRRVWQHKQCLPEDKSRDVAGP